MFTTGVLCTVCGAQVYLLDHKHVQLYLQNDWYACKQWLENPNEK